MTQSSAAEGCEIFLLLDNNSWIIIPVMWETRVPQQAGESQSHFRSYLQIFTSQMKDTCGVVSLLLSAVVPAVSGNQVLASA